MTKPSKRVDKNFVGICCDVIDERLTYIATSTRSVLCDAYGINTKRALDFLFSLIPAGRSKVTFVTFGARRDVEFILRDLPDVDKDKLFETFRLERRKRDLCDLLSESERRLSERVLDEDDTIFYKALITQSQINLTDLAECAYAGYTLTYRAGQMLRIKRKSKSITIHDIAGFFDCALSEACERHKTSPAYIHTEIRCLSAIVPECNPDLFSNIEAERALASRTWLQCVSIAALAGHVATLLDGVCGIRPRAWSGSGPCAAQLLRNWEARKEFRRYTVFNTAPRLINAIDCAYHAGRFEQIQLGHFAEPVAVWDINSAYAAACLHLPQMQGDKELQLFSGNARTNLALLQDESWFSLWFAEWNSGKSTIGLLPYRSARGVVTYRQKGSGWYYDCELRAALAAGAELNLTHGYVMPYKPVTFGPQIQALYNQRALVPLGDSKIIKGILTAIYGKFAQTRGRTYFLNRVWAGYITALVRARLLDLIRTHALKTKDIVSFNQDAIHLRLDIQSYLIVGNGAQLGQWRVAQYDSATYLGCGIYELYSNENGAKKATRGFNHIDFPDTVAQLNKSGVARMRVPYFAGHRLAQLQPFEYEYLSSGTKELTIIPSNYATRNYDLDRIKDWASDNCGSEIHNLNSGRPSAPFCESTGESHISEMLSMERRKRI